MNDQASMEAAPTHDASAGHPIFLSAEQTERAFDWEAAIESL